MNAALGWHLAESTAFALLLCLLTLAFRNSAQARHRLLVTAVLKFAVPLRWFTLLGAAIGTHVAIVPLRLPVLYASGLEPFTAVPLQEPLTAQPGSFWPSAALGILWGLGTALLVALWLRRLGQGSGEAVASPAQKEVLASCARQLDIQRMPAMRMGSSLHEPCVRGVWQPRVVIPAALEERLGPEVFRAVLLHELAHVKRRDNLWAAIVHGLVCLFWFFPLLLWLERRIGTEAELACDALVLQAGTPREAYLAGLLEVCRMSLLEPTAGSGLMGGVNLKIRLEKIMSNHVEGRVPRVLGRLGGVLLAAGCGLAFATGALHGGQSVAQAAELPLETAAAVEGCQAGQPQPFAPGTVIRHIPRQQMQVCVVQSGRPVWLTLAANGVPAGVKVVDLVDAPPPPATLSCKETAPQGKLCTCDDLSFSPGAVVGSPRGKLVCPASGGHWQPYKGKETPWPPVALSQ